MHVGQCSQGTSIDLGQLVIDLRLMVGVTILHEQLLEFL
jgi:hypothetical protein